VPEPDYLSGKKKKFMHSSGKNAVIIAFSKCAGIRAENHTENIEKIIPIQ